MDRCSAGVMLLFLTASCLPLVGCSLIFSADPAGGAGGKGDCTGLDPLRNTFDSPDLAHYWRIVQDSSGNPTYSQGNGRATFVVGDTTSTSMGWIESIFKHDLTGTSLTVHVDEVAPATATTVSLHNGLTSNTGGVEIRHLAGELIFDLNGSTKQIDYNPEEHKVWRIREEDGRVFLEAGRSEQDLTSGHESNTLGNFDPRHVFARIGTEGDAPEAGQAVFSGINLSSKATEYCSADSLVDSFLGTELDTELWQDTDSNCSYLVEDETLHLAKQASNGVCNLQTTSAFSLHESHFEIHFDSPLTRPEGVFILSLERDDTHYLRLQVEEDEVWYSVNLGDGATPSPRQSVAGIELMRIRHEGDKVYFEVETASEVRELDWQLTPFDLNGLTVGFTTASLGQAATFSVGGINAD